MVINFNKIKSICNNNKQISKLYQNNILIWQKKYENLFENLMFLASSIDIGTYYTFDGKKWNTNNILQQFKFDCICYYNDIFIAGIYNKQIYYSNDNGNNWKLLTNQIFTGRATTITVANDEYLMYIIQRDNDTTTQVGLWYYDFGQTGSSWVKSNYAGPHILSLAFNNLNGNIIAGTENGLYILQEHISNNNTWHEIQSDNITPYLWENVLFNIKHKICIASSMIKSGEICSGGLVYLDDMTNYNNWKQCVAYYNDGTELDLEFGSWKTVIYGNNEFIANSVDGDFIGSIRSTDGKTWYVINDNHCWNVIEYGNGIYVGAVLDYNTSELGLYYSNDAINWNSTNITTSTFNTIEYMNPLYSQFLNGTTLKYYNTNYETIKTCGIIDNNTGNSNENTIGVKY